MKIISLLGMNLSANFVVQIVTACALRGKKTGSVVTQTDSQVNQRKTK
jgi:hypothetical protein